MDAFESRYFKINKVGLCLIGQWVYQTNSKNFIRFLTYLSLTSAIVPQFYFLFSVMGDADQMWECLPAIFLVIMCYCQVIIFTLKQNKLRILVKQIQNDWNFWTSGVERKKLQTTANYGRFLTLLYATNIYVSVIIFILMGVAPDVLDKFFPLNETRPTRTVYAAKYPIDETKYRVWVLIHGSITSLYNVTTMFGCEAMYAVTTLHVCGLFKIVSTQLKEAMKLTQEEKISKMSKFSSCKKMAFCVKWHYQALRYSEILNSCFSPILFCSMVLNVIAISGLLIQILNSIGNLTKTLQYGIFCFACMVHLYCLTLPAQILLDSSLKVSNETYDGEWYNLPINVQKFIISIICRSQKPSTLTIGKFATMDMVTFSMLFKTSISYFTVLSSMRS